MDEDAVSWGERVAGGGGGWRRRGEAAAGRRGGRGSVKSSRGSGTTGGRRRLENRGEPRVVSGRLRSPQHQRSNGAEIFGASLSVFAKFAAPLEQLQQIL